MIYTIGKADVYGPYLQDDPDPCKLGRDDNGNYEGGSVWQTRRAAQTYLDRVDPRHEYGVYGVLADWDTQTEAKPNQDWHNLLVTSRLVELSEVGA